MSEPRHVLVILLIYAMLLAPKVLSLAALPLTGARMTEFGGKRQFAVSMLSEILLAILYAPILMVQQMIAVIRSALSLQKGWSPQQRDGGRYGLSTLLVCHAVESISGVILWGGILSGLISVWLAPIALSLVLAVPLSALSGLNLAGRVRTWMGTQSVFAEPRISQAARYYRDQLRQTLEQDNTARSPAE
jgi:membrane glycosyltransferase